MSDKLVNDREFAEFKYNFGKLYNYVVDYLITKEWAHLIDRNVRVYIPMISQDRVEFELIHTMTGSLEASRSFTWEEINELPVAEDI